MKIEEAAPGRWIEGCLGSRLFIVGNTANGELVVQTASGTIGGSRTVDWSRWELLPAECDSFAWKPETFPQWYLPSNSCHENDVAYIVRESSTVTHSVFRDGRLLKWAADWKNQGQKQITEAEALARLDKPEPVESPDDWVTLPKGEIIRTHDKFDFRSGWDFIPSHSELVGTVSDGIRFRRRRKDLPPEPATPATRTVVLTEWLIERDGEAFLVVKNGEPLTLPCDRLTAIGTREIEAPL